MRSVEVKVYGVDELSKEALAVAYDDWLTGLDYIYAVENKKTLDSFIEKFPIKVSDYSYGGCGDYIKFKFTFAKLCNLRGVRLLKYLINNYYGLLYKPKHFTLNDKLNSNYFRRNEKGELVRRYSNIMYQEDCYSLTGYYMDEEILASIYEFIKNPNKDMDFYRLLNKCLNSWLSACTRDYEYCTSEKYFMEECITNEVEFYSDGTIYREE